MAATMPPGMTWPPPEWGVGGAAPDPLTALPPGNLTWPPAAWTAGDERPTPILPPPGDGSEPWDAADIEIETPAEPAEIDMSDVVADQEREAAARIRGAERAPFAAPPGAGVSWPPPEWGIGGGEASKPTIASPDDEAAAEDLERMAASEKTTADIEDDTAAKAEAAREAEIARLADLDPETWQRIQDERQLKAEHARATEERLLAEQQRQALEDNIAVREKARSAAQAELDEVTASAKEMSDTPFEAFWSSRSMLQKAAGYLSAFISGFGAKANGGRNTTIDLFLKVADDNWNAKLTKMRERRINAREQLGAADDDFRMREAVRQASYEQGVRFLESKLANLDPQGEAAMRIAGGIRDLRARQQQAAAAAGEHLFKRGLETYKAESDRMRAEADALRARAEAAKKLGLAGGGAGGGTLMSPADLAKKYKLTPEQTPAQPMGEREFLKQWLPAQQKLSGITADIARQQSAELDRELKVNEVTVTDPATGGDLFRARTVKEAEAARTKVQAARQLVNYIDEIIAIRKRVGGESKIGNSDDYQRLKVLEANVRLIKKSETQGMSSDNDLKIIADAAGAADVTSWRSRVPGLRRARALIESQLNGFLHDGQGYQGAPIKFRNLYGAKKAPRDPDVDALVGRGAGGGISDPAVQDVLDARGVARPTGPLGPSGPTGPTGPSGPAGPGSGDRAYVDAALQVAATGDGISDEDKARMAAELTPDEQAALDRLTEKAAGGDKDAARKLGQVMAQGNVNRRASHAAMMSLAKLVANGNKAALDAMRRQVDPDSVDDDEEDDE